MPDEPKTDDKPAQAPETAEAKQEGKDRGGQETPPEPGGGKPPERRDS